MSAFGVLFPGKKKRATIAPKPVAGSDECPSNLEQAVYGLSVQRPEFSARIVATQPQIALIGVATLAVLALMAAWPRQTADAAVGIMAVGFLLGVVARGVLVLLGRSHRLGAAIANDIDWPVYSILVPLYHEAEILPQLVKALSALDYPADKRDILLVLEEDDSETRAAAEKFSYACVFVPSAAPRTKPKACTYATSVSRGEFIVVFDAEDRPEPDQLKKAVNAFRSRPDISCFQARLVIDRPACWLQHGIMAQTPLAR